MRACTHVPSPPSPVTAASQWRTPMPTTTLQTLRVVATPGDPLMPLDPTATRLEALAAETVDADGTVVVHGEGHYDLDRTIGTMTFEPEPAFTGPATPMPYVVTDAVRTAAEEFTTDDGRWLVQETIGQVIFTLSCTLAYVRPSSPS